MGKKIFPCFTIYLCFIVTLSLLMSNYPVSHGQSLDNNFYARSCPNLLNIVRYGVMLAVRNDTRMAASLLRLHFHDCIVDGCEASVLLDDTDDFKGEKNTVANGNSLRGYEVIDDIKAAVERFCPATVSCADIVALAAREAVLTVREIFWPVPLGRRDGTTASQEAVNKQIPSPFEPLEKIIEKFTNKGLDFKDVVVLSGAHTLGYSRCLLVKGRLYNFRGSGKPDPALDSSLRSNLQSMCPDADSSDNNLAPFDRTPYTFDNVYYTSVRNNAGLLQSDHALMGDPRTAALVNRYSTNPSLYPSDFIASMGKLGIIGVLTGQDGEIRQKCGSVN